MDDENYGRSNVVVVHVQRYSGRRASVPRAVVGSSDGSEGTFGPAQGTPSRRDAR